jgi:pescadillo protein
LIREFDFYVGVSKTLKKAFISIKGIYLTSEILGQEITWLTPFNYPSKLTFDIDYSIMLNFLELYTNLLKFVNFKLYKDLGLDYPPFPDTNLDKPYYGLDSLAIKGIQTQVADRQRIEKGNLTSEIDCQSAEMKAILEKEKQGNKLKNLFNGFVFWINREVPKEVFSLAVLSCGGLFGDESDGSAFDYKDKRITHYIIDRPIEGIQKLKNKEYIQPQWIFDCINSGTILPLSEYEPGHILPPHISPYFEFDANEYKPTIINKKTTSKDIDDDEEEVKKQEEEVDKNLNKMLMSNNQKKLYAKIEKERILKMKRPKKKE